MDDAVEIRDAFERQPALAIWPADKPGIDPDAEERQSAPAKYTDIRNPTLSVYEPPAEQRNGTAAVVCPGGGYGMVSCVNEGHPIALWLNSLGVSAYVLKYRLPTTNGADYHHPVPLADAQRAMRLVRGSAEERGLSPERIGIVGFSAGGHLAATACTLFDQPVDHDPVSCRPDFSILIYSVMCFVDDEIYHDGSRAALLGSNIENGELCSLLSPNLQVTAQTPPAFLAHAKNDGAVPYQNSVVYHEALKAAEVPTEMHLYDEGGHGFGMGNPDHDCSKWPAAAEKWLRGFAFIGTVGQV